MKTVNNTESLDSIAQECRAGRKGEKYIYTHTSVCTTRFLLFSVLLAPVKDISHAREIISHANIASII